MTAPDLTHIHTLVAPGVCLHCDDETADRCAPSLEPHHAACRTRSADEQRAIADFERRRRVQARFEARWGAETVANGKAIAAYFQEGP